MNRFKYANAVKWIFIFITLICVFIFYMIHPFFVFDADDWTYISQIRKPIPNWNYWNPTRVFPEVVFPICGYLGVKVVMPLTGDYIGSIAIVFAVAVSITIVIYFALALHFLDKQFDLTVFQWILLYIVFVLYHFADYGLSDNYSTYVLFGSSLTNTIYYTLCNLVNASLVLYLFGKNKLPIPLISKEAVFLFAWIYFAINSNLYSSIILISYVGVCICSEFISSYKSSQNNIKSFIYKFIVGSKLYLFIFAMYAGSLLIEYKGGRSKSFSSEGFRLAESASYWLTSVSLIKFWLIPLIIVFVFALIIYIKRLSEKLSDSIDSNFIKNTVINIICLVISVLFLILLSAKVTPNYMKNSKVLFAWLFWLLLLSASSISYIMKRIKYASHIVIIFNLLLACMILFVSKDYTSAHTFFNTISVETVKSIDEYIINQVKDEVADGKDSIELLVPVFDSSDNWPLPDTYGGERIANTLFKHGIIDKWITLKLIPDYSLNQMFDLE